MDAQTLTDAALDWYVAQATGVAVTIGRYYGEAVIYHAPFDGKEFAPSRDWAHGGPLLQRANIGVTKHTSKGWHAHCGDMPRLCFKGATPLEAAMRCLVAQKFGAQLPELPAELR